MGVKEPDWQVIMRPQSSEIEEGGVERKGKKEKESEQLLPGSSSLSFEEDVELDDAGHGSNHLLICFELLVEFFKQ